MESSFSASTPDLTSFPLEKFSHSSSAPTSSGHQWIHESKRDGLFLVFQKTRVQGTMGQERLLMRISSGGNVLELQDVGDLLAISRNFESMSQSMGLNTSRIDAPVQIVVKRPCIAMRYTKAPLKVQRIQVRFKHDLDYDNALNIFRDLGLPIKDAAQAAQTAAPKGSSPTAQLQSDNSNVSVARQPVSTPNLYTAQMRESESDHQTKLTAVSLFRGPDRPHSTGTETLRSSSAASRNWLSSDRLPAPFSPHISNSLGSLARNESEPSLYVGQILGRSSHEAASSDTNGDVLRGQNILPSTFSDPSQRTSNTSVSISSSEQNARPISSTFLAPPGDFPSHESLHDWPLKMNNNQAQSGTVSSIYVSQMRAPDHINIANGSSRTSPAITAYGLGSDQADPRFVDSQDSFKFARPMTTTNLGPSGEPFTSLVRNSSVPSKSYPDHILSRPKSVPTIHHDDYWLPPRRELPFLKERENEKLRAQAAAKASGSARTENASSAKDSTSLPSPTAVESKKPVRRVAERNMKQSSTVQDELKSVSLNAGEEAVVPSLPRGKELTLAKQDVALSNPPSTSSSEPSKTAASSKKRPSSAMDQPSPPLKRHKMVNQSTQTQTLPGWEHSVPLAAVPVDAVGVSSDITPIPTPATVMDQIDDFVKTSAPRPAPVDPWKISTYAEASEELRRTLINDWICDNLENEDFLKLCEDVEHAWRRTGMGF